MMYFVAFKLQAPFEEYGDLERQLKAFGPWSNRLPTTWLIESALSARMLRDLIKPHLRPGDRLFVGQFSRNWSATAMGESFPEWMGRRKFEATGQ